MLDGSLNEASDQSKKPTTKSNFQSSQCASAKAKDMINGQHKSIVLRTTPTVTMPAHCVTTTNIFDCLGLCAEVC